MASGLAFLAAILLGNNAVPAGMPDTRSASEPMAEAAIFAEAFGPVQHQVRIERRVIVRITPFSARRASSEMSIPAPQAAPRNFTAATEVKGGCIPLSEVAGVQLGEGRRLLLFMRDRRVITASFERSCPVQGFYSGFYVERPADGMLCAGRERLHARSGADCTLGSFAELQESQNDDD
jgi:hypothetical protein